MFVKMSTSPSLPLLTLIGALAYGADIVSSSVHKPHKWVHVRLTSVAPQWPPCTVVHQVEGVLTEEREEVATTCTIAYSLAAAPLGGGWLLGAALPDPLECDSC